METEKLPIEITGLGESGEHRPVGVHFSDIREALDQEYNFSGFKGGGFEDKQATYELGFIWEKALETAWKERCLKFGIRLDANRRCVKRPFPKRPRAIFKEGIWCSLDGLEDDAVWEFKATWKSSRGFDPGLVWRYQVQAKAYCWVTGKRIARFAILFINGNYRGSGPQVGGWECRYTRTELYQTWRMLKSFAREKGWI